jgi:toxin ParE1/3/4
VKVFWTRIARERVKTIAREIAADHPEAAARWAKGISAAVGQLARFPESGRLVPEVGRAEIREVLSGRYRIIYVVEPDRILVLAVRHQRQDTSSEDLPDPA